MFGSFLFPGQSPLPFGDKNEAERDDNNQFTVKVRGRSLPASDEDEDEGKDDDPLCCSTAK